MKKHLTEEEFNEVQARISSGDASITIPRRVARQFFTHISNSSIKNTTLSSALWQKSLTWTGVIGAPILLVACCLLIISSTGWWAAIAVPLVGIFWTILAGLTNEDGGWPSITIALVASIACFFFLSQAFSLPLFLFVSSLWVHRMTYILTQRLLITLVNNFYPAYDMLTDHIELDDPATSE
ncbi:MAG: hypothetical protein O6945_03365 [Gammaproteobacteria bacterium]|nr:hypothetical protein [Gammaproteobacteria bacterium]